MQNLLNTWLLNVNTCVVDKHTTILIIIMLLAGAFGGYLNYLNSFDIDDTDAGGSKDAILDGDKAVLQEQKKRDKRNAALKYTLLGIGAAFLVPAFLKMINSNLVEIKSSAAETNTDYLIFTGFCLVAAIFSRRFITSIGEKILEAAKKAQVEAKESKQTAAEADKKATAAKEDATTAHKEALTANESVKDVRQNVELKNTGPEVKKAAIAAASDGSQMDLLLSIVKSYPEKTRVSDYKERIKMKGDLRRAMGEIIVKANLDKEAALKLDKSEGMLLGIAYSIQLKPAAGDVKLLNEIAQQAREKYTLYNILQSYDTLARNQLMSSTQVKDVYKAIADFGRNADSGLVEKLDETRKLLKITFPDVEP